MIPNMKIQEIDPNRWVLYVRDENKEWWYPVADLDGCGIVAVRQRMLDRLLQAISAAEILPRTLP